MQSCVILLRPEPIFHSRKTPGKHFHDNRLFPQKYKLMVSPFKRKPGFQNTSSISPTRTPVRTLRDGEKIAAVNGINYVSRDVRDGVAICTYATDKGVELYFIANVATGEKNILTQQDSQGLYMVFDYSQPLPTA